MISYLLFWLALPLLLTPFLVRREGVGAAAGELMLAGLGLAAFWQGAGSLDPVDLRMIASQSPRDAWFVAITAGAVLSGACLALDGRSWRARLPALPLILGLLAAALEHPGTLAVGLVIGFLPSAGAVAVARLPRAGLKRAGSDRDVGEPIGALSLGIAGVTLIAALRGPAIVATIGLGALSWCEWFRNRSGVTLRRIPLLPVAASVLLAAWIWLLLTIAGSPLASLQAMITAAPISPAAEVGLALLALGWTTAIAAPWPLDRMTVVTVLLPVVAVVARLGTVDLVPDGITHWQPAVSAVLAAAAVIGTARRRWDGAAASLALLGATRGGGIALASALMLAAVPLLRRTDAGPRFRATYAGLAVALLVIPLLRDQVLLSVLLVFALAAMAAGRAGIVAPAPALPHL